MNSHVNCTARQRRAAQKAKPSAAESEAKLEPCNEQDQILPSQTSLLRQGQGQVNTGLKPIEGLTPKRQCRLDLRRHPITTTRTAPVAAPKPNLKTPKYNQLPLIRDAAGATQST